MILVPKQLPTSRVTFTDAVQSGSQFDEKRAIHRCGRIRGGWSPIRTEVGAAHSEESFLRVSRKNQADGAADAAV